MVPIALSSIELMSMEMFFVFMSINFSFLFIYTFGWTLTANKKAIKLILFEFEFWFKLLYLFTYLVASIRIDYFEGMPIHFIIIFHLCEAFLFILTMITGTLNMSQNSKIVLTAFTMCLFITGTLSQHYAGLYQPDLYNRHNITIESIPNYFGLGAMNANVMNILQNSIKILAIFTVKQIAKTIQSPNKAAIIKKSVFIIYEDQKEAVVDVRMWKIISIGWWMIFLFLVSLSFLASATAKILRMIMVVLVVITICLHLFGSNNALYASNIIILIFIFLYITGWYLFAWEDARVIGLCLFGFGLTIIYTLNTKRFNQNKHTL